MIGWQESNLSSVPKNVENVLCVMWDVFEEIKTVQVLKSHSRVENTKDKTIFNKSDNRTTTFDCKMTQRPDLIHKLVSNPL